ncbi:MAG: MBL fold metallo-hydrolase [Acidimicrobiales bacterium]|nr:MBL fold metallo-hydrolase [Acidimicrobiales bacterium]RZV47002.1 MAG: MBL fold metallo-hydrolase [Acidimicrobiales bacterium]
MTTEVIVTGTGTPLVQPHLAGPGVLVRYGDLALQFDAGRNTLARIKAAGTEIGDLTTVFLTHYHSDHLVGLQDIVLSHFTHDFENVFDRLELVAPSGATKRYCDRMLDIWDDDLHVRAGHRANNSADPKVDVSGFDVPMSPTEVWSRGEVRVLAGPVRHEPVVGAVGFRIETPDGVVVITGDTLVCDEVAELARGADVVVYEAMRFDVVQNHFPPSMRYVTEYHADAPEIGRQMAALEIPNVMLTHLIPATNLPGGDGYEADVRAAGYTGNLVVCDDLDQIVLQS